MSQQSAIILKRLLPLAHELLELKAWKTMAEMDFFCLQSVGGDLLTVSVMGNLGEYHAIAFYRGEDARTRFLNVHIYEDGADPMSILSAECFHISLAPVDQLRKSERQLLTAAGIKLSKSKFVPQIEAIREGSIMNHLDDEEAKLLEAVLPQTIEVLREQLKGKNNCFDGIRFPLYRQSKTGTWRKTWQNVTDDMAEIGPNDTDDFPPVGSDFQAIDWAALPFVSNSILLGYRRIGGGIANASGGIDVTHVFMVADGDSGQVIGVHPYAAALDPRQVAPDIIQLLTDFFVSNRVRPVEVQTCEPKLEAALEPFLQSAGIHCRRVNKLPMLDEAYSGLDDYLDGLMKK